MPNMGEAKRGSSKGCGYAQLTSRGTFLMDVSSKGSAMSCVSLKALNMFPLPCTGSVGLPQFHYDPGKVTVVRWS